MEVTVIDHFCADAFMLFMDKYFNFNNFNLVGSSLTLLRVAYYIAVYVVSQH